MIYDHIYSFPDLIYFINILSLEIGEQITLYIFHHLKHQKYVGMYFF